MYYDDTALLSPLFLFSYCWCRYFRLSELHCKYIGCRYNSCTLCPIYHKLIDSTAIHGRAVARSENPGGLVVLGGDNVPPMVEIGLTDLPKIGGAEASQAPPP